MNNPKGRLLNIAMACTVVLGIIFLTLWIKSPHPPKHQEIPQNLESQPHLFQTRQKHQPPHSATQHRPHRSPTPFWNTCQRRKKKPSKMPAPNSSRPTRNAPTKTLLPPPG